jgi:hypothetical protein
MVVFCLGKMCRWAFSISFPLRTSGICFLLCAFFYLFLCIFHLIPKMCPAKHVFWNTSGNRLIVKAYVSKYAYFSLFGLELAVIIVR